MGTERDDIPVTLAERLYTGHYCGICDEYYHRVHLHPELRRPPIDYRPGAINVMHENGPRPTAQGWADAMEKAKPTRQPPKVPLATGCYDYFPDALLAVAEVSRVSMEQHGIPGELPTWDRSIAPNEADALARHFLKRGTLDTDGQRHSAKVAWRALALLQKEIEAARLGASLGGDNAE
jgi:hypothetical protein